MARVTGNSGTNWGLIVLVIVLIVIIAVLAFAFLMPGQLNQIIPGLNLGR